MDPNNDIPVYLFVGFLESGKTTMIREMLTDEYFTGGGKYTYTAECERQ